MDQNVIVTIGIPVYNGELFLKNAIKSVLNQTFSDFELIITDDGSTDKSVLIVQSFQDSRIKLITDGINKGISYRITQQILLARGKYFARMDADDLMFPTRIEKQIQIMESDPLVDVIGCQAIVIDNYNIILGIRPSPLTFDFNTIFKRNLFIHSTVLGKTKWFKEHPYNETLNGVEDYNLWITSYKNSKFYVSSEPLMFYRDPLTLNLNTYLSRHYKLRKAYLQYRSEGLISIWFFMKIMLNSYLKSYTYLISSCFWFKKYLVNKRNEPLIKDKRKMYDTILDSIIKE